jgi:tetratricopeptide (TPR) repeat protein
MDPLGNESAEEMLSALLGHDKQLIPLKRQIVERTQGTPFFMEEMVQALFEEGVIQRNGSVKLAKPMSTVKVPATVQAVLASRIDRLPKAEKELLQILAVLGREFPLNLVKRVTSKPDEQLEQMLVQLELGEFIFEQPAPSDAREFIFKHALTQEVAYNSLLGERRRALHDQAARGIEDLYANQLEDHYSYLAHHYVRGNDAGTALRYSQLAAEQALSRAAYVEAMSLIDSAVKLLDELPEGERTQTELAFRTIERTIAFVRYGASSKERERAIRRTCELAEKVGETEQLVRALSGLSTFHYTRGDAARGLELVIRCLTLGNELRDNALLVDLHYNAGMVTWRCGKFRDAVSHQETALRQVRAAKRSISPNWGMLHESVIPVQLALDLFYLGRLNEAIKLAEEGLRYARESKHLLSLGAALIIGGAQFALDRNQPDVALAYCEEAIGLSQENGFAEWLPWGQFIHGWGLFELAQVDQGLLEMEAGLTGFDRLGGVPRLPHLIAVRAAALARIGRMDEALAIIKQVLTHIQQTGDTAEHAEILRLKGEVLLISGPPTMRMPRNVSAKRSTWRGPRRPNAGSCAPP